MWPDNRIRNLFGIDIPIVQAPMAGSSGLDMAVAVSEAGGLGSLACAALDPAGLQSLLGAARNRTDKPLNVNFFAHCPPEDDPVREAAWMETLRPYYAELDLKAPTDLSAGSVQPFDEARCAVVEAVPPCVVSFHFGLPSPDLVKRVKAAGCKVISSATTVKEACWLVANGCDAVIAQGFEAGGHRGMFLSDTLGSQMGTVSLVPQVADAVDVPVIAAGGIGDARGIVAAMALGASAAQIGTAYLFTEEALVSPLYRQALEGAATGETVVSNVFSGRPTRVLANRLTAERGPMSKDAPSFPKGFAAIGPLKAASEDAGNRDFSAQYCGQSAALARRATAFSLTRDLATEALKRVAMLRQ
ncbi:nitronate monooxygenase [Poseidonocella pacifica]|uniref:Nitronate monooxygenase n=1 Tax=Poseidonocella pacifica TaxID=871651 RepID=A0A1I0YSJ1_9RHOB|nr:nitronate monooxygenase [Poseidonocella pacifica]SFB16264.1 nitronate monooxygenase [Poseidonocella pacifica]